MEGARRRKLAELVTDHVLADEHRYVLAAVVDAKGDADELRQDGERRLQILTTSLRPPERAFSALRSTKPSTKGPFQTERLTSASLYVPLRRWRLRAMNLVVRLLRRVL